MICGSRLTKCHLFSHHRYKLVNSNRTYFQCDVAICRGECEKPQCDGEPSNTANVVRAGGGPLAPLDGSSGESSSALKTIGGDDPFARPEDDAVTTSTSVFVAQPGTEESGKKELLFCCQDTMKQVDYKTLKLSDRPQIVI